MFSGGDPLVWFGNAFQNDGIGFAHRHRPQAARLPAPGQIDVVVERPVHRRAAVLPAPRRSASAARGHGDTQSIDPEHQDADRAARQHRLPDRAGLRRQRLLQRLEHQPRLHLQPLPRTRYTIVDLSQTLEPRPRPQRLHHRRPADLRARSIRPSPAAPRVLVDVDPGAASGPNVNAACFTTSRDDELMLTNADGYRQPYRLVHPVEEVRRRRVHRGRLDLLQPRLCLHRRQGPPEHVQLDRGLELRPDRRVRPAEPRTRRAASTRASTTSRSRLSFTEEFFERLRHAPRLHLRRALGPSVQPDLHRRRRVQRQRLGQRQRAGSTSRPGANDPNISPTVRTRRRCSSLVDFANDARRAPTKYRRPDDPAQHLLERLVLRPRPVASRRSSRGRARFFGRRRQDQAVRHVRQLPELPRRATGTSSAAGTSRGCRTSPR